MLRQERLFTAVDGTVRRSWHRYDEVQDIYFIDFFEQPGPSYWAFVADEDFEASAWLRAASEFLWVRKDAQSDAIVGFRIDHYSRANQKVDAVRSLKRIFSL